MAAAANLHPRASRITSISIPVDPDEASRSPFHYASQTGDVQTVINIVKQQISQTQHQSPAWIQARLKNYQALKERLPNTRDDLLADLIRSLDSNGYTALHYAVQGDFISIVECLLEIPGIQVTEVRDHAGRSALHWAAHLGRFDVLERLIHSHASVIAQDPFGWTPLHYLCASETARDPTKDSKVRDAILLMIEQKSPRGELMPIWLSKDWRGRTPLHLAARYGVTKSVFKGLLELDPTPQFTKMEDVRGWNILHWATFGGNIAIVINLLNGIEIGSHRIQMGVNDPTYDGWSALHLAAMSVHAEWSNDMISMLVKDHHANALLEDKSNRFPLYYAHLQASQKIKNIRDIISLLQDKGAGVEYRKLRAPNSDRTAFNEIERRQKASQDFSELMGRLTSPASDVAWEDGAFRTGPCIERLKKAIQQKGLESIFMPSGPQNTPSVSDTLRPYAESFSTLPMVFGAKKRDQSGATISRELLMDLGALVLYDRAVIIDDSASMGYNSGGWHRQSVLRVLRNLDFFNQMMTKDRELRIYFASTPHNHLTRPKHGFDDILQTHSFDGTSVVGTALWNTVIKYLRDYNWKLHRGLVVVIVTDGEIDPMEMDILERGMLYVTRKLQRLYPGVRTEGSVIFQFVNVGFSLSKSIKDGARDAASVNALRILSNHSELGRAVACFDWEDHPWDFSEIKFMATPEKGTDRERNTKYRKVVNNLAEMMLPMMRSYGMENDHLGDNDDDGDYSDASEED